MSMQTPFARCCWRKARAMHVIFRETHGMEETAVPQDLGQEPADLVVLSFSDSDLGAFAAAWHQARAGDVAFPSLRLANLAALMHPLSVDTYVERTLSGAKAILIRLIGGTPYWSYGLQQVEALARSRGIALAVLPGDGWEDARLDAVSTVPVPALRELAQWCDAGGAGAAQAALAALSQLAGLIDAPARTCDPLPMAGGWHPGSIRRTNHRTSSRPVRDAVASGTSTMPAARCGSTW